MAYEVVRELTTGALAGREKTKIFDCPYLEDKVVDSNYPKIDVTVIGKREDGTLICESSTTNYLTTQYFCKANGEPSHPCVGNMKEYSQKESVESRERGVSMSEPTFSCGIANNCPIYKAIKGWKGSD